MSNSTKDLFSSKPPASSIRKSTVPSTPQNPTIINVEAYPECEFPERSKLSPEPAFSPRLKQARRDKIAVSQSIEKESDLKPSKKTNFNDFLNKMEQFRKSKNEKIIQMQAVKKVQEEEKLNSMPKIKMSEMSKKILEDRKKRNIDGKDSTFAHSPSSGNEKPLKSSSASLKVINTKILVESLQSDAPKLKIPSTVEGFKAKSQEKEAQGLGKSEKVLASKLVKEFNSTFDEVGKGKFCLNEKETRMLMGKMYFLVGDKGEDRLVSKMWSLIGGDLNGEVSMENLRTFLLGVMNLFLQSMTHSEPGAGLGRLIGNRYYMNQEEVLTVHKHFLLFSSNRNSAARKLLDASKPEILNKAENIEKKTFKPESFEKNTKIEIPAKSNKPEAIEKNLKVTKNEKFSNKDKNEGSSIQEPVAVRIKDHQIYKVGSKNLAQGKTENVGKDSKMNRVQSVKSVSKNDRENCMTPRSRREVDNLNTSFRSARSKSRSKFGQDSARSSMSESDWAGINNDKISDPSILLKAQDLLGAFSSKTKKLGNEEKTQKKVENEEKAQKKAENEAKIVKKMEKVENLEQSTSSKLLFKKNIGFKSQNTKGIDDELKKANEMLKGNSRSPAKKSDDIVVEVSMPDGTQKTLIIPLKSNHQLLVQKFVNENNLTNEMGKILLNSIGTT